MSYYGMELDTDAPFFPGTFPIDFVAEQRVRSIQLTNPSYYAYNAPILGRLNQRSLLEADYYSGQEAWDYQNPYVWESSAVLTVPDLVPVYGGMSDTGAGIIANVTRTQGMIVK